jgi:hypothetical protein
MGRPLFASIACVLAMTTAASADPDPQWIVLKVRRVHVAAQRPDNTPWDPADDRGRTGCHTVGAAVSPADGIATVVCVPSDSKQGKRDASAPDLVVQVAFGENKFRTAVARDTLEEAFDFPIAVPLEAVPATGVELRVLDLDDDVNGGELIGSLRVTPQQLREALTGSPLLALADGRVEKLHLEVRRYEGPKAAPAFRFAVNQNPVATRILARAGELVTIAAKGTYSVRGTKEQVGPDGYRAGADTNNRREFETASHAGALVYIGSPTELHASLLVGRCMSAIAPVPGQIHVGVNDTEIRNNRGAVEFTTTIALPTVAQWKMGGSRSCAKPDTTLPLTNERVLSRIQTAYLASIRLCYKEQLRRNPNARGKVTLSLTIDGTGKTIQGDAQGFSRDVDICINKLMPAWRFQIPRDGEDRPTTGSFAVSLMLQP